MTWKLAEGLVVGAAALVILSIVIVLCAIAGFMPYQ